MSASTKVSTSCGRHNTVNGENDPESDGCGRVQTGAISRKTEDNCEKNKPVNSGTKDQHFTVLKGKIIYRDSEELKKIDKDYKKKSKQWRSCHICETCTTHLTKKGYLAHLRDKHHIRNQRKCQKEAKRAIKLKGSGKGYPIERRVEAEEVDRVMVAEGAGQNCHVARQVEDVDQ